MKIEIKFRAWDGRFMHYKVNILSNWGAIKEGYSASPWSEEAKAGTPMQFTGLHDKNGKEVYEGDVLRFPDGRICEVIWHNYMWAIESKPFSKTEIRFSNMDKDAGDSKIIHHADRYSNLKKGEIIGNIYENPELLQP